MIYKMTMEYIDIEDICKHFGKRVSDYSFVGMAENGSYIYLDTCDEFVEEILENIKYFAGMSRADQYQNTLELVRYLRDEMGVKDGICVYVCW